MQKERPPISANTKSVRINTRITFLILTAKVLFLLFIKKLRSVTYFRVIFSLKYVI